MAQLLTFLGKGGVGRTTVAIATAKQMAAQGSRVLFASQDASPAAGVLLGVTPGPEVQTIGANLSAVQLQAAPLLERAWEEVKQLEAKYLRSPILKNVYGQELSILPGMDKALALYALREFENSGDYDVIIYDGQGDLTTLRTFGIPETMSWYIRRFRQVFIESDLGRTIAPFVQPVSSAVLNMSWSFDDLTQQPTQEANSILDEGRAALADPNRVAAYLVTTSDESAIATAKYLWGSAQQVNLTVSGVIWNQGEVDPEAAASFAPLSVTALPTREGDDWQALMDALPSFRPGSNVPKPVEFDVNNNQIRVYLPTFSKNEVKLTQYGTEITIEAGDQRRNINPPAQLRGRSVRGAKFQDGYLIISF